MALTRITADFVRHWYRLRDATADDPSAVRQALDKHPDLEVSIMRLHDIMETVNRHRKYGRRRFIYQAHPEFRTAISDFERRWGVAADDLDGWHEANGCLPATADLLDLLDTEDAPAASATNAERPAETNSVISDPRTTAEGKSESAKYPSDFDPHRDDLAWIIKAIEQDYRCFGGPTEQQWAEALTWLRETVGLNFTELQTRWNSFPLIVVPQRVSDRHSIDGAGGLFGYLTQVRLAYMVGADRAAIALCRAVTELLVQFHYASDLKLEYNRVGLAKAIEIVQDSGKFEFLKRLNLAEKVRDANKILHDARRDGIRHRDPDRGLIMDWIRALEEVIEKAPAGGPTP